MLELEDHSHSLGMTNKAKEKEEKVCKFTSSLLPLPYEKLY
jgi:hypothetical protein